MALLFYYALLAVWPLLLWPALRLSGWARVWLWLAVLAGLLASAHEVRLITGTVSAIRLDIPLIALALGLLYGLAALALLRARWRRLAGALGVVLLLAGGGLTYSWIEVGREAARLTEIYNARNALLFEAKFRNPATYESVFRMADAGPSPHPVGHWAAEDAGYFSRLIVNPAGAAWAFYPCGATECAYTSAAPGVQTAGDGHWTVTLVPPVGTAVTVQMTTAGPDRVRLEGRGAPSTLTKAPPPIDPAPAPDALVFLGPFVHMDCRGRHAEVRQLWLWQEDARLYGVGVFATLVAGAPTGFVTPMLLGEAVKDGTTWTFQGHRNGQSWRAAVDLEGPAPRLTLERDGALVTQAPLERAALFRDEVIELAPLTSKADWDRWFDIVLVGHGLSGDIPPC